MTIQVRDAGGTTRTISTIDDLLDVVATAAKQDTGNAALATLHADLAALGEVQASPTANTVLDRLKAIWTALTGTLTVAGPALTSATATIASGQSLQTTGSDCSTPSTRARRLVIPGDLKGISIISAATSFDNVTYSTLCNLDGSEWNIPVAISTAVPLDPTLFDGANYVKFRGGTSGTGQAASADLVLTLIKG